MDDLLASVAAVGPPLVLLALGIVLLVRVGPNDWSLVRPRWEPSWPRGVQEEEPHAWDLTALGAPGPAAAGSAPTDDDGSRPAPPVGAPRAGGRREVGPTSAAAREDPPIRLTRVRASPPGPWRPRRT